MEEVLIPKGKTRTIPVTVPADAKELRLKCYSPAGPATIIEVDVESGDGHTYKTTKPAQATAEVTLDSFVIKPSIDSARAGAIKFVAFLRRDSNRIVDLPGLMAAIRGQ